MNPRKFGPKAEGHPSVGQPCAACHKNFVTGDYTTLIPVGPGDNEEARQRCADGQAYNAVAVEVHWACATGEQ